MRNLSSARLKTRCFAQARQRPRSHQTTLACFPSKQTPSKQIQGPFFPSEPSSHEAKAKTQSLTSPPFPNQTQQHGYHYTGTGTGTQTNSNHQEAPQHMSKTKCDRPHPLPPSPVPPLPPTPSLSNSPPTHIRVPTGTHAAPPAGPKKKSRAQKKRVPKRDCGSQKEVEVAADAKGCLRWVLGALLVRSWLVDPSWILGYEIWGRGNHGAGALAPPPRPGVVMQGRIGQSGTGSGQREGWGLGRSYPPARWTHPTRRSASPHFVPVSDLSTASPLTWLALGGSEFGDYARPRKPCRVLSCVFSAAQIRVVVYAAAAAAVVAVIQALISPLLLEAISANIARSG